MESDLSQLTNDAKFLLSSMYKIYVERRENNQDKRDARLFGNINDVKRDIMPEWSEADVFDTCAELKRKGFINAIAGSNSFARIELTTDAVAQLELTFKDKVDAVLDYLSKIKSSIPFL